MEADYQDDDICPHAAMKLFKAIVAQAFEDAVAPDVPFKFIEPARKPKENELDYQRRRMQKFEERYDDANADRRRARQWLLLNTIDFPRTVSLAGYDVDYIRDLARRLRATNWSDKRISIPTREPELAMAA